MSWFLAFAGFAILVILHELGHFTAAKAVGMRVEKFSLFFPPTILSKKIGETEYAIGCIPAGGYVKITGMNPDEHLPEEVRDRAYHAQPVWKRIVVIAAGPAVNLVLALVLLVIYFAAIGDETGSNRVGSLQHGYPAAGLLKPGDKLISVDGHKGTPEKLGKLVASHKCAERPQVNRCVAASAAVLTVDRNGTRVTERIKPIYDRAAKRTRVGFAYAAGPRKTLSLGKSLDTATTGFWFITKQTAQLPVKLFHKKDRDQISGIVGSYEVTRQTFLASFADAIKILAIISLALGLVNLFPFLPLDGGHIFWAVVEKIRGTPVPLAVMERSGVIGFMLVIGLFVLGLSNDIGRLTDGQGFQIR